MAIGTKLATALWLQLAVAAASWATDPDGATARADGAEATIGEAAKTGPHGAGTAGGPRSPAQRGVVEDLRDGKRNCAELTGKERAACDARAAATAQVPRGREGANPTGSTKPSTGSNASGR